MANPASPKTMLERGLTRRQKSALRKTPPVENIRSRREGDKDLSYLEGWYVIAEANRIFGTEYWDRVTLTTNCVWQGRQEGQPSCAYTARVRICVRAGAYTFVREGSGLGQARANNMGEAHGAALKAAETDATKRALATLGAPFGLMLYDTSQGAEKQGGAGTNAHEQGSYHSLPGSRPNPATAVPQSRSERQSLTSTTSRSVTHPPATRSLWIARGANGETIGVFRDPVLSCSCLRRAFHETANAEELQALFEQNRRLLARLRSERPELRSEADQHYSEILSQLFQARLKKLALNNRTNLQPGNALREHAAEPDHALTMPIALSDALTAAE